MWPFSRRRGKTTVPTTEEIKQGGWSVVYGTAGNDKARSPVWDKLNTNDLQEAMRLNSLVRSCVTRIASAAVEASLELGYYEHGTDQWTPIPKHPLLDLMRAPNEYYDYELFLQYVIYRLLLTGESYIWKWRNTSGRAISELWPLPTDWVKRKAGTGGAALISGYEVRGADGSVPSEDMIRGYFPDPQSTVNALSPLQSASDDYQVDERRKEFFAEMLDNMDVPGLVLKVPAGTGKADETRLRAVLSDRIGRGQRGNTLLLRGENADAKVMNPLADLDWPGFTGLTETRIAMAFNVSTLVVGARVGLDESPYANFKEARKSFYQDTMRPMWRSLAGVWTRGLLHNEGETRLQFRYNTDNIPELQVDKDSVATRAAKLFDASLITRNQARAMIGQEEDPIRGDVYLQRIGTREIPANEKISTGDIGNNVP